MKKIESFKIDHTKLEKGLYVSKRNNIGEEILTTLDLRIKTPYKEPYMDLPTLHSLEHLLATELRQDDRLEENIIYVGPMGCGTGMYVIFNESKISFAEMQSILYNAFDNISRATEIPGATQIECGNYTLFSLSLATRIAREYADLLSSHEFTGSYD